MRYASIWRHIEVYKAHALSYRRTLSSAVVKLTVKEARQASRYMRMMGYGTTSVPCMDVLSVVLKTRKRVPPME
jgi:hypothetical protein